MSRVRITLADLVWGPEAGPELAGQPVAGEAIHIEAQLPGEPGFTKIFKGPTDTEVLELDLPGAPGTAVNVRAIAIMAGQAPSPASEVVSYTIPFPPLPAPRIISVEAI